MASQIVRVDELRSIAYGSLTSSYQVLGTAFEHTMRIIRLVNTTDGELLISFDGSTDNLVLPAGSFVLFDLTTNQQANSGNFVFSNLTQVYVKYSSAPSSGSVYLEAIYGKGE